MKYSLRNIESVAKVTEILSNRVVLVMRCSSLNSDETFRIREKMWDLGSNFGIVKNSLAKIAFANSGFSFLSGKLVGSIALAYCDNNLSKFLEVIFHLVKEYGPSRFSVLSGKCDSQFFSPELMSKIALFPDESYVYIDLVNAIRASASSIVDLLNSPARLLSHYLSVHSAGSSASSD